MEQNRPRTSISVKLSARKEDTKLRTATAAIFDDAEEDADSSEEPRGSEKSWPPARKTERTARGEKRALGDEEQIGTKSARRKSRWGEGSSGAAPPPLPPPSSASPALVEVERLGGDSKILPLPRGVRESSSSVSDPFAELNELTQRLFGTTRLTPAQQAELSANEEAKRLQAAIRARRVAVEALARVTDSSDSVEEEILQGSWEHRKREEEMEKTKSTAQGAGARRGGHHLNDFLPPEELQRFLRRTEGEQPGTSRDTSEYQDNKLGDQNKGFQLLKKMGWAEGSGLGSKGQGITAPVAKGRAPAETQGLGSARPDEVGEEDDEYALYRKRMMTAYKYRPNPLNNPRRPYY